MRSGRGATGEEKENGGSSPHSLERPLIPSYLASLPFYTQLPLSSIVPLYSKKHPLLQDMKKCCTYSEHSYDNSNVLY